MNGILGLRLFDRDGWRGGSTCFGPGPGVGGTVQVGRTSPHERVRIHDRVESMRACAANGRPGASRPLAVAAVLALLAAGCGWAEDTAGSVGSPAPEYAAPSAAGDTVSLADLEGEVVLLNIWATWCPPCRVEMPHLQSLHEELGEAGLRVVGVSVDSRGAAGAVDRFTSDLGIGFLILRDPSERISHLFGAYGVPFNVLIDREGIVRWRHSGPLTADDPALRSALDAAL